MCLFFWLRSSCHTGNAKNLFYLTDKNSTMNSLSILITNTHILFRAHSTLLKVISFSLSLSLSLSLYLYLYLSLSVTHRHTRSLFLTHTSTQNKKIKLISPLIYNVFEFPYKSNLKNIFFKLQRMNRKVLSLKIAELVSSLNLPLLALFFGDNYLSLFCQYVVNFINILQAAFVPIFLCQKHKEKL
jgi:hypothetical protein